MKYNQNIQLLMSFIPTIDQPNLRESLETLGEEIKSVLNNQSPAADTAEICRRLVSTAPAFNGRLFGGANIAGIMRCAAREIRHAATVAA
jgi:hypothetical protein